MIFYALANKDFINQAKISLYTFFEYNDYEFYLFVLDDFCYDELQKISDKIRIINYPIDYSAEQLKRLGQFKSNHADIMVWSLKCFDYIKHKDESIVKIDLDILHLKPLNIKIDKTKDFNGFRNYEQDRDFDYINFGFTVINTKEDLFDKFFEIALNDGKDYKFLEQDFINYYFTKSVLNFRDCLLPHYPRNLRKMKNAFNSVHFCGHCSPYSEINDSFSKCFYKEYLDYAKRLGCSEDFINKMLCYEGY